MQAARGGVGPSALAKHQVRAACPRRVPRRSNLVSWPVGRPRREAVAVLTSSGSAAQHLKHLLRIRRPVGGQVQRRARRQPRGEQGHESGLDQAPFVVALLRPRIGKEHHRAGEGSRCQHVLEHRDGVVLHDAHVVQRLGRRCAAAARRRPADGPRRPKSCNAAKPLQWPPWHRPCQSRFRGSAGPSRPNAAAGSSRCSANGST